MSRHIFVDYAFVVLSEAKIREMMANGIEAFIIRGGYVTSVDATVAQQVPIFNKCNAPFGVYRYWVAGFDAIKQGDALAKDGLTSNPGCLAGDEEDRHEYYSWTTASQDYLSTQYHTMANEVKAHTVRPYLNYSGPWFVEGCSAPMGNWLKESWFWGAQYPHGWDQNTPDLWPKTYAELHTKANALQFPQDPLFPTWAAWQFGGNVCVNENGHTLDYSIVDRDDIFNWMFNGGPMPVLPASNDGVSHPATPTTPYKVINANGIFVRALPDSSSAKLQWLAKGALINVVSITNGWAKLYPTGYCSANPSYIQPV
jgi:hypothetical protein